jgi:hypothetical protein
MSEKLYPLIVWFYYEDERQLFTKISFDNSIPEHPSVKIARRMAEVIQYINFDRPIEIALMTQSTSNPTTIELVRANDVNIHTLERKTAVFALTLESESRLILELSEDEIEGLFCKRFYDFQKSHKKLLSEKRASLAMEVERLDEIYKALDF